MTQMQDTIQFVITNISKTPRPGRISLDVHFPGFHENKKLCVYSSLSEYIVRTSEARQSFNTRKLFISFWKPYKVVCVSSIISLAKNNVFKGHSIRIMPTYQSTFLSFSRDTEDQIEVPQNHN